MTQFVKHPFQETDDFIEGLRDQFFDYKKRLKELNCNQPTWNEFIDSFVNEWPKYYEKIKQFKK